MCDIHTRTACRANLVASIVLLPHRQLVKFTCDVVCCCTVGVPVGVHAIGGCMRLLFFLVVFFITPPANSCTSWMVSVEYLTHWIVMLLPTNLLLLLLSRAASESAASIGGRRLSVTAVTTITTATASSSTPARSATGLATASVDRISG